MHSLTRPSSISICLLVAAWQHEWRGRSRWRVKLLSSNKITMGWELLNISRSINNLIKHIHSQLQSTPPIPAPAAQRSFVSSHSSLQKLQSLMQHVHWQPAKMANHTTTNVSGPQRNSNFFYKLLPYRRKKIVFPSALLQLLLFSCWIPCNIRKSLAVHLLCKRITFSAGEKLVVVEEREDHCKTSAKNSF